jgi:hypothetical protein
VRLAIALGALALGAGGLDATVLPRPTVPGPAAAGQTPHRLVLVSSRSEQPVYPNAPERITWQGTLIRVRTYDHVVTVRLKGA